ncbi:hypothetical protein H072_6801 [Dactylellina haptotyla CBS 200.50]|uniref:Uncharacterized protein n=1 Tax=Dactylellina haptotyla (strain CBS 200.50) TaxID=1284197 RepID=S8AE81_DACHA|nr:hypothetical protein H072_6801 [Dactylellina haptotyla CBS 200.50]
MPEGCGVTLSTVNLYYSLVDPANFKTANDWQRNYWWYMSKIPNAKEPFVQTLWEAEKAVNGGKVPQCNVGGWLRMMVHQVNDDGGGPFRCRIDRDGKGQFGDWLYINPGENPAPGDPGAASVYPWGNLKAHPLVAQIPKNQECNIKIGSMSNICIMRCENFAANGPFGDCIPFQLMVPPKPQQVYKPPVIVSKPVYGNSGYNVNNNPYKEYGKREIDQKRARRNLLVRQATNDTEEA